MSEKGPRSPEHASVEQEHRESSAAVPGDSSTEIARIAEICLRASWRAYGTVIMGSREGTEPRSPEEILNDDTNISALAGDMATAVITNMKIKV
jgi:hypothetical protein